MNILFCERLKAGDLGTYSVHIYEVVNNLLKLGHNVVLMNKNYIRSTTTFDVSQQSLWSRIKKTLITWRILRIVRGEVQILWLFLREIYIFISASIIILKHNRKFDVIYRRSHIINSESILAKLFKIPTVLEVNTINSDEVKTRNFGDRLSLWIIDRLQRFSVRRADRIIAVTSKLKEALYKDYGVPQDKITVIQNGADTDLFKPIDIIEAREKLGLDKNRNYICFVGSLWQVQGLEYLIRSIPLVLEKCPGTCFMIVGNGPIVNELINLSESINVSANLIFTGDVPYREVPVYINASDVCVAPFTLERNERMGVSPLKLCEYMACQKPVVTSRLDGLEIVEENTAGCLVEPNSVQELATAIIKLLQDKELRSHMGENGGRYVRENQSWAIVTRKVAEVCQSLHKNTQDGD